MDEKSTASYRSSETISVGGRDERQPVDKDIFNACMTESFAPLVKGLTENCVTASQNAVRQLQKLYEEKDEKRRRDTTKLREEITHLTVRLHERGVYTNLIKRRLELRNERLARCYGLKSLLQTTQCNSGGGGGEHVLAVWRRYAWKEREKRRTEESFSKRYQTKRLQRSFVRWLRFYFTERSGRERSVQATKLDTITRAIISRYEDELEQVRSDLSEAREQISHGDVLRRQLEERMRKTILQGMTAMNIETMALLNDSAADSERNSSR